MLTTTWNSTRRFRHARLGLGMLCIAVGSAATAAPGVMSNTPDAGAIMRNQPTPLLPAPSVERPLPLPAPAAPKPGSGGKVLLKQWKFHPGDVTLIPEAELQDSIRGYLGRELSVAELSEAAQKVAMYYRLQGYLVRAWLPEQTIGNGEVEIRVVEGRMGDVNVTDPQGTLPDAMAKGTLYAAHPQGEVLRMQGLERGVLLLNDMPGVSATPTLKQGSKPGTTDVNLKIDSRPVVNGMLDYANAGVNSVGANQFGGSLFINNAIGVGDQATFRVQGGSGNVYGRLTYSMPVGYSGLRVGVAGSSMYYVLGNVPGTQFRPLNEDGDAWVGGIFASYPLVRGSTSNLYTLSGFDTRRYHNVSAPKGVVNVISDKIINVGYVGFQGDLRDDLLGGGFNNASFYMSLGNLDLTGNQAYESTDGVTARTAGTYEKFTFTFSRLQNVVERLSFWSNFAGQVATKNLDSSEKFSLGGPYGVRAYPVNEALADQGYLMNFELRYSLCQQQAWCSTPYGNIFDNVQLVGFIDHGGVTLHSNTWTGSNTVAGGGTTGGPNNYTLSGGGFGINWISPGDFALKFSVAQRIGTNPYRSSNGGDVDGTHNTPQFWAQLSKYF